MAGSLAAQCGQILVVGLAGVELSLRESQALARAERGGVVLFKRNVTPGPDGPRRILELTNAVQDAARDAMRAEDLPPLLVAIDQEGGRVVRIGPPALVLPAMRRVGDLGDPAFAARLAEAQAKELAAMGITLSFAPVADIHTRPENPIIGDRAFASTPEAVASFARAWARGLAAGGVLSCAKHFPGHGDTTVDSHLALPIVERSREELDATELAPFAKLAREPHVASMMTAHVVYPALDPEAAAAGRPATLSPMICKGLLRDELGFAGVLFSDDLEMKAIHLPAGEAAVLAVAAGCDVLLVCSRADLADEAHAALVREAESSPAFRARIAEALGRFVAMRMSMPPRPAPDAESLADVLAASAPIAVELASRLAAGAQTQA